MTGDVGFYLHARADYTFQKRVVISFIKQRAPVACLPETNLIIIVFFMHGQGNKPKEIKEHGTGCKKVGFSTPSSLMTMHAAKTMRASLFRSK